MTKFTDYYTYLASFLFNKKKKKEITKAKREEAKITALNFTYKK